MESSGWSTHPPALRGDATRPSPVALGVPPLRGASGRTSGWRAISRFPARRVKTPGLRRPSALRAPGENAVPVRTYARAAAAAALLAVLLPAPAGAQEPLCDWLLSLGRAAQAHSEGDFGAAEGEARRALRARPRGAAAARASASLGIALLAREDAAGAAEALEEALGTPVPAPLHLARARGEALLAAGDAPRAARLFAQAARGDLAVSRAAALREAEALLAAGLAAEAVPQLESLLRAAADPVAAAPIRLSLAEGLRAVGRDDLAVLTLRALWLEVPDLPEALAAGEELAAWRRAGGPVPPDAGADHVARAERLLASGRADEALLALGAADRADEPVADVERAAALRAVALLALGRHADAERQALPLAGAGDGSVQRAARLVLARAAARGGRVREASRLFADVGSSVAPVPGLPEWRQRDVGDESAFLAAWLFYDAGEYVPAIEALEAFARANPRSRRAEDALWFAAWSRYRLGRTEEADRALAKLARGPLADAALYWRGRLARGRAAQRAFYRRALAIGGEGWYALLARARLAALGEPRPRARPPRARAIPDVLPPWAAGRLSVAVELLGLGLRAEALAELRELSRGPRVREAAPLVAQLAAFAGDFETPFRLARDHLARTRRTVRWLYPEPLPEVLLPAARRVGVDPALVLAVIRRESSFRPDARSAAGAEGLLQLRPATAERLASLLGVPGGTAARLHEPETAIALGAHYLALLVERFGDPALAIAAYNAGPAPVAGWAEARAGMALDAWVESIPYRETRQYVKIVLPEWDLYRALAGEPPAPIDPDGRVSPPAQGVAF
jgi:soluble lytic murein transglycosylase